jgi:CBS domain containing-hemolysin-like protein
MKVNIKWVLEITIIAFLITILFSLGSQLILDNINLFVGIIIILFFILLGVVTDIIGVSVQSSDTTPFHAMASKKIKSAKQAKKMINNAAKVSSFFCDVVGDVCNIITGSAGVIVSTKIAINYGFNITVTLLIISSLIAALTIGGKALGKTVAINNSEKIVHKLSYFIHKLKK